MLRETPAQYTACFSAVDAAGFPAQISNGVDPHKRRYFPLRARYQNLPAHLACSLRVKAMEAVKCALTWQKKCVQVYHCLVAKAQQRGYQCRSQHPRQTPCQSQDTHGWRVAVRRPIVSTPCVVGKPAAQAAGCLTPLWYHAATRREGRHADDALSLLL